MADGTRHGNPHLFAVLTGNAARDRLAKLLKVRSHDVSRVGEAALDPLGSVSAWAEDSPCCAEAYLPLIVPFFYGNVPKWSPVCCDAAFTLYRGGFAAVTAVGKAEVEARADRSEVMKGDVVGAA